MIIILPDFLFVRMLISPRRFLRETEIRSVYWFKPKIGNYCDTG